MTSSDLHIGSPRDQLREGRLVRRFSQLIVGLVSYGASIAMLIRSNLGVMPWDVLHQGLARKIGFSIGTWTIITSIVVLLLWIPLRQRPGVGTFFNVIIVGISVDVGLAIIPSMNLLVDQLALMTAGVLLNGIATAAYVGVRLGPGARDGLMTGLTVRTGLPVRLVRTDFEAIVLISGGLLGGTVGVATLVYALSIGPLVQRLFRLFIVRPKQAR